MLRVWGLGLTAVLRGLGFRVWVLSEASKGGVKEGGV